MNEAVYKLALEAERKLSEALTAIDRCPVELTAIEFRIRESAKTRIRNARERVRDLRELAAHGEGESS